eukprot:scaffold140441_cov35-Tisochrysis_lutea.AAC.1
MASSSSSSRPSAGILAAERETLRLARKQLEHRLRILQAEEAALLQWKPGQPLPTPEVVPEYLSDHSDESDGFEESDEELEAVRGHATTVLIQPSATIEHTQRISQPSSSCVATRAQGAEPASRMPQELRTPSGQHGGGGADAADSDWEDDLMDALPEDSPWVSAQAPRVLTNPGLARSQSGES